VALKSIESATRAAPETARYVRFGLAGFTVKLLKFRCDSLQASALFPKFMSFEPFDFFRALMLVTRIKMMKNLILGKSVC
jgi:hypothetical protein